MKINGVDFDPREIQTISEALDRMEAEEADHAESLDPEVDGDTKALYEAESNLAHNTLKKWHYMVGLATLL